MATLLVNPGVSDRPISTATFDAGINASSAWTEHLESASSDEEPTERNEEWQSDDTPRKDIITESRPARALYDFDGEEQFRELVVSAGDSIDIVKEEVADGWSLAQFQGVTGLIPRKYYTFTSDFSTLPSYVVNPEETVAAATPLQPQVTGQYFASIRNAFLGGKTFNRFSSFVTSGAEEWVLNGAEEQTEDLQPDIEGHNRLETEDSNNDEEDEKEGNDKTGESDRHFVEMPPSWKAKSPPFRVLVHSPSKQTSPLSGSFTVYAITSLFNVDPTTPSHSRFPTASDSSNSFLSVSSSTRSLTPTPETYASMLRSKNSSEPSNPDLVHTSITVYRRFSHFAFLHTALSRKLPGIALPPLPEKQYAGRFSDDFVEARRGDLERWISRIVRHPVARYAEVLIFFLSCDNEIEWRRSWPRHLTPSTTPGPSFYSQVFHPAFNLDADDAAEAVDRFQRHVKAVGKSVQGLRTVFGKLRDVGVDMSVAQRNLSYSILSLITSTPHVDPNSNIPTPSLAYQSPPWDEDEDESGTESENRKGLLNDEGAWCWRDDCEDCLRATKSLQKMAETLQSTADIYDDHARRTQLVTQEMLKDVAHPDSLYAPVIDTHRATLSMYKEAAAEHNVMAMDHQKAARCETVLNTTMAEFETYHVQKLEDFHHIATEHLDGEIAFHEQMVSRLKTARAAFTSPGSSITPPSLPPGPRQPSIYERDLSAPRTPAPLPQPTPHVFDQAHSTLRPVSVAVREGVGIILGGVGRRAAGASAPGGSSFSEAIRGSVFDFGKLWSWTG